MDFAVGLGRNERIDEIADHARVAEESGFTYATFVDIPFLNRDVYVMMTIAALNTHRIRIGHGVTDPVTRHPSVTANLTATISELSGGRAFVGIGTGGPWGKVMKPAPLHQLRQAVEFIKKFTAGEEAEFQGAKMQSEWSRRPVPVYIACGGPRSCQLAGEIADGAIFTSNADPTVIKWRLEQVEKGARKVGRDPTKIDVWARGMIYVAGSKEEASRQVAGYAVNGAYLLYQLMLQEGPEIADLRLRLEREEPGLIDECKRVYEAFDPMWVEHPDAPAAKLVTQRIIDSQHLVGRPEEVCEKLHKLQEVGVKAFGTVTYTIVDKKGMMREIGNRIMPHFRN